MSVCGRLAALPRFPFPSFTLLPCCALRSPAQAVLPTSQNTPLLLNMALPVLSVLLSITVGVCGGLILSIVMRPQSILVPVLPGMSPTAVYK